MATLWDASMEAYTGGSHVSAGESASEPNTQFNGAWGKLFESYTNPATPPPVSGAPAEPAAGGSPWDRLIAQHAARPPAPPRREGGTKVSEQYVIDGLMQRGLPRHVAEGFAMNFADESGFDAGINEIAPLVEGSRGGYGLYQLTGPRRRQYESMAQRMGRDVSDPDLQMDFLMQELQTTEKRAGERIMQASNAGEAGAAIVNHFLRPAQEYRQTRANRYLGRM